MAQVHADVKHLLLPDLRTACRARGVSPAGSRDVLQLRLTEYINEVGGNFELPSPAASHEGYSTGEHTYEYAYSHVSSPRGSDVASAVEGRAFAKKQGSSLGYLFGGGDASAAPPVAPRLGRATGGQHSTASNGVFPESSSSTLHSPQHARRTAPATSIGVDSLSVEDAAAIKSMALPDLRNSCRRFGLSPAGNRETLQDRITAHLRGQPSDTPEFQGSTFVEERGGGAVPAWMQGQAPPAPSGRGVHPGAERHGSSLGYLFGRA